jgi:hypothetical protein
VASMRGQLPSRLRCACLAIAPPSKVRTVKPQHPIRTRHDEWTKRALSLWLKGLGDVQLDARIAGQSRRGDVLYTERRSNPAHRRRLGTLGELARGEMLFELYRNPPTELELKSCVVKLVELEMRGIRTARRAKRSSASTSRPTLCVVSPSMSKDYAAAAGAAPISGAKKGLYTLSALWRTVIVIANELPEEGETLWLRLLGRGEVQRRAAQELLELSGQDPLRDATLELLIAWQQSLPPAAEQSEDERELTMNLEQVYKRWERKIKAEGKAEGMLEGEAKGKAEAVLAVLRGRGLTVSAAQRKQVLACTDNAQLDAWLGAAGTTPSVKVLLSGGVSPRGREKRS